MLFRPLLGLAALAVAAPAFAAETETVAPIQAVTQAFGDQQLLAYYTNQAERCDLVAMTGREPGARVRVALAPSETATIEDVSGDAVALTCGPAAARMTVERTPALLKAASAE
jgi:hypothetical protein